VTLSQSYRAGMRRAGGLLVGLLAVAALGCINTRQPIVMGTAHPPRPASRDARSQVVVPAR